MTSTVQEASSERTEHGPVSREAVRAARRLTESTQRAEATGMLTPRFYTTDVAAMNRLSVEPVRAAWTKLLAEFEADRNRGHFVKGEDWDFDPGSLSPELRKEFLDFLVSSLTAEFSGCVLYAELHKKGFDPDLKMLFKYLSRDEARHAGFINECLKEFGLEVDMSHLAKNKEYTYFSPKMILYATYLSEKIGYARYITIYRHLERHPEHRFHPIFTKFERWCSDEFRHGEALAVIMRANPSLLSGVNRFWVRFFQVAVYATMFVRDHSRHEFHAALGLEPESFGMDVFRVVAEVSKQVFPVLVDVENPAFLQLLRQLNDLAARIDRAEAEGALGVVRAMPLKAMAGITFLRLLALPAKTNELPTDLRATEAW
jgi:magnesium-protoporphyrin IX monomethyl ester (oxidative) cyclase